MTDTIATADSTHAHPDHDGTCEIKLLSADQQIEAAQRATTINPRNSIHRSALREVIASGVLPPASLAVLVKKYWGTGGVHLTVGFMETTPADLRARIVSHMNAWSAYANVQFVESSVSPQVRISRGAGGYWSYLGTDILSVPANEQTMNLAGFTMATADSEFHRVVRHETGHTLGFPHEHTRSEIVNRIDREKAIASFMASQGWSRQKVIDQVLTPLDDSALMETAHADPRSIMCYWLPGNIMKDGVAVTGGADIDAQDAEFAGSVYPRKGWSGWVPLGQPAPGWIGSPATVSRNPAFCNVYVRGADNALWQNAWINSSFNGWGRHGDGFTLASDPAVGSMGPNHEHVFVRGTDNQVHQKYWTADHGWSGWFNLGAPPVGFVGRPAIISRSPSVCNIYVRGVDNALWQKAWSNNGWGAWGRHNDGGVLASEPTLGSMGPNHEHVFVKGTDGQVYQKWWTLDHGWSGWVAQGTPAGGFAGSPATISRNTAVCNVYVRGVDNALWQKAWFDNHWGAWGRHNDGGVIASDPAPGSSGPAHEQVFARGTDNQVWQKWWRG